MAAHELLHARIGAVIAELDDVGVRLKKEYKAGAWYDRAVKELRDRIAAITTDLKEDEKTALDSAATRSCWHTFLKHHRDAEAVIEESRALIEGMLARIDRLDDRLCVLADGVLDELDKVGGFGWNRFTILGRGEMYSELAHVIRVRFPVAAIWDLPIALHEFGHFVGTRPAPPAFPSWLESRKIQRGTREWHHGHEFFADAFAAFTCGPAFACACVMARFKPVNEADEDAHTHPSDNERVIALLRVLEQLERSTKGEYRYFIGKLRDVWSKTLAAAEAPPVSDRRTSELVERALELYDLLERACRGVMYSRPQWARAMRLQEILKSNEVGERDLPPGTTLVDVLNAAWYLRVSSAPHPRHDVAARARKACEVVMARQGRAELRS